MVVVPPAGTVTVRGFAPPTVQLEATPDSASEWSPDGPVKVTLPLVAIGWLNEPSIVTINPNERLEYLVNVSTRDMVAGETYNVEGFFPNFEHLRKTITVTAEK